MPKKLFKKGEPPPPGAGRKPGQLNRQTYEVKAVFEAVAKAIGGHERMIAWVKESPQNEYAFWTGIYPRLLPIQATISGSGPRGEIELTLNIKREDLVRKLDDRGLPHTIFGMDKPLLELTANNNNVGDAHEEDGDETASSVDHSGNGSEGSNGPISGG